MSDADQNINVVVPGDKEELFGTVEAVVDEKKDMIDFTLVEDDKAKQHIDHNLEEVIADSVALEDYISMLRSAGPDGVSKQTAKAIAIGIKRIDRRFGTRSVLRASLEDEASGMKHIGDGQSQSGVNEEGLVGRAKELWAKFVEILKTFIDKAKAAWQKLTDKNEQVIEKAAEMKANAREEFTGPNDANGGRKVTIPAVMAWLSCPGGKQVPADHYHELVTWCLGDMAGHVQDGIDDLIKAISEADMDAVVAIRERKAPEYTGTKFPQIEIKSKDVGGWEVVTDTQGDDVVIPSVSLSEYTALLTKVEVEGKYLVDNRKTALGLIMQLMRLLKDATSASYTTEPKIVLAILETLGIIKAQQEQVIHVYQFISQAQSAILMTLGKQI